ncbi:PREDICTED: putative F-box/kelch-repeat protein At4g22430 [Fragaria vesca subsp. vesca]|uniref:putative F-box/kelch-repeat protein At4g22430 n=1 Tax=Fragaria vesca subsp. vesca TaxID=101020 RepID=UPI0002C30F2F|nr:PREDICTED: putative F-box/kelch-repeat protein At4g22430 [Fragaria vesca subsp. vesca]
MRSDTSCTGSTTLGSQSLGAPTHQSLSNPKWLKNINDLPEILLVEIFCRLPCKFALRCKCVCKSWSTLVSDPYFDSRRALYLRNNCDNDQVLMFVSRSFTSGYFKTELFTISKQSHQGLNVKPLDLDPRSHFRFHRVVAAYNDLILLCYYHTFDQEQHIYYICNPTTKQWVALPSAPPCEEEVHVANVGFACDSDNRCCKVVRILALGLNFGTDKLGVQIFSSETGKWIDSDLVLQGSCNTDDRIKNQTAPVAHDGTLYWITHRGDLIGLELFSKFNINSTKCHGRFISSPRPVHHGHSSTCVCQGSVRLCHFDYGRERYSLSVWDLKEDEEWCFKELVDLHPLMSSFPVGSRLLAFDPNDQDILYIWRKEYTSNASDILMCNIRKLTVTEIFQFKACVSLNSFPFVLPWGRWPTPVPRLN